MNSGRLDKFIFGLYLLCVITLTNSIFLTQIGYFGALLLLLYKWISEKRNPFQKSGLELPFLLFIIAEILSTIFSVDPAQAAHTLIKRFMIIPLLYVTIYVASDEKRVKLIVKVFLGAAFLTAAVYLVASFQHYIEHLYSLETKGPSTFQYVMTAGGLLSVISVFFFSFFINEKLPIIKKILLGFALLIILIALAGSFTRAAWLGTAAGIAIALLLRKQWIFLVSGLVLIILYVFLNPKVSSITEYEIASDSLKFIRSINTEGRVSQLKADGEFIVAADYDNGLLVLKKGEIISGLKTEKPVVTINKWRDDVYYSTTLNKTFFFFSLKDIFHPRYLTEYIPKYQIKNGIPVDSLFYIFGSKGEVTILRNPSAPVIYSEHNLNIDLTSVTIERNFMACFSGTSNELLVFSIKNNFPDKIIYRAKAPFEQARVSSNDSTLAFWTGEKFRAWRIKGDKLTEFSVPPRIENISGVQFDSSGFWGLTFDKRICRIIFRGENLKVGVNYKLDKKISGFLVDKNLLYTYYSHKDRITSIVDPYHSTNIQRLNQWKTGWRIFKANPIFGVGDIDMNNIYFQYRAPYDTETYGHLHNNYVHVLEILGGFGFLVFIYLMFTIFILDLKIYNRLKNIPFASSVALGTIGAFIAFLVSGLAEWNFGDQEIATMLWFATGLNIALYKLYKKDKDAG